MMSTGSNPLSVQIFKPDYSLKNKVGTGVSVRQIFTPDVISECQRLIEDFKDNFFYDSLEELREIENAFHRPLTSTEAKRQLLAKISALKSRSESIGFSLLTDLMESLETYTETYYEGRDHDRLIVQKHLEALRIAVAQHIRDQGGDVGGELMDSIRRMVEKLTQNT